MKNVQNEHFQVESLNKKFHISKVHIWGPTHNLMKNVQNEHFQEVSFNSKKAFLKVRIWRPTNNLMKNVQFEHSLVKAFFKKFHSSLFYIYNEVSLHTFIRPKFTFWRFIWYKTVKVNTLSKKKSFDCPTFSLEIPDIGAVSGALGIGVDLGSECGDHAYI